MTENELILIFCFVVSCIIAVVRCAKSILLEVDIKRGAPVEEAVSYRKKLFHKKEEAKAYKSKFLGNDDAGTEEDDACSK